MSATGSILVVEEDADIAEALTTVLSAEGYCVLSARSAAEAVALLTKHREEVRSIVLDAGYCTRQPALFRDEQLRTAALRDIPVLVISSGLRPEEDAAFLQSTSFLRMPFDLDALLSRIAASSAASELASAPPTVLVVEDDEIDRDSVMRMLRSRGFEAVGAPDGETAFRLLERMDRKPVAIILDLGLPGMQGQAFRALQLQDRDLARIPVIVVTANIDADQDASLAGVAVLIKPLDTTDFARQLTAIVPHS